jgi:hypothetical protein
VREAELYDPAVQTAVVIETAEIETLVQEDRESQAG